MPVLYKPFQSFLEDKNKKKLFHPRVIYTANVSTTQLAKEIAAYSSLSTRLSSVFFTSPVERDE